LDWVKDYLFIAFLAIALHLLPWTLIGLIAYFGRLGAGMILAGLAFECLLWYNVQKRRARNYLSLILSNRSAWDIDKSIKEYLEYVRRGKKRDE
jgi:hypothetical protein